MQYCRVTANGTPGHRHAALTDFPSQSLLSEKTSDYTM